MDENYSIGISVEGAEEAKSEVKGLKDELSKVGKDTKGLDLFGEKVEKAAKKAQRAKKAVKDLGDSAKQIDLDFGDGKGLEDVASKSEAAAKSLRRTTKAAKEAATEVSAANSTMAKSANAVVSANEKVASSAEKSAKAQAKSAKSSDASVKGRSKFKQSIDDEAKSAEHAAKSLERLDDTGKRSTRKKSSEANTAALREEEAQAKRTAAANKEVAASRVSSAKTEKSHNHKSGLNPSLIGGVSPKPSQSGNPSSEELSRLAKSLEASNPKSIKAAAEKLSSLTRGNHADSDGSKYDARSVREKAQEIRVLGHDAKWRETSSIVNDVNAGKYVPLHKATAALRDVEHRIAMSRVFDGGGKVEDSLEAKAMASLSGAEFTRSYVNGYPLQAQRDKLAQYLETQGVTSDKDNSALKLIKYRKPHETLAEVSKGLDVPVKKLRQAAEQFKHLDALSTQFYGGLLSEGKLRQTVGSIVADKIKGSKGYYGNAANLLTYKADRIDAHTRQAEDEAALRRRLGEMEAAREKPQKSYTKRSKDFFAPKTVPELLKESAKKAEIREREAAKLAKAEESAAKKSEARLQREAEQSKKSREKSLNHYRVMQDIDKTLESIASGKEVPTREINSKLKTLKSLLTASENIAATPELSRQHRDRYGDKLYNQLKQPKKIERRISAFEDEMENRRYQQWFADKAASDAKAQAVKSRGYAKQSISGSKEVQGVVDAVAKTQATETKLSYEVDKANRKYSERIRLLQESLSLQSASVSSVRNEAAKLRGVESAYQHVRSLGSGKNYEYAKNEFVKEHGSRAFSDEASKQRNNLIGRADNYNLKKALDTSNALHGTWRGLTAAAGQIWLSWGNIAAMLPGLAAGFAVFQSLSVERKFGWEIEQVGIVGAQSKEQLDGLRRTILDINKAGSLQGPIEMAQALGVLAKAGLSTKESMENLKPVLNFSLTADISNEQGALFAAGLRSAFNLETPEQLRVGLDQTAKAADVSQTSIEAMSEALKQASPVASRFGLSVSDTSAALALLARYNIEGSAAGTSFRNFLTDLAGRTDKSKDALKELGLSFYDARGQARPLLEVVRDVQAALGNLSPKAQQDWLKKIFDERGLKTASILLSEAGKDFEKTLLQISRGGENLGYTERAATKLADTSEGAFRRMKNAWEGFFADVGSRAESPFKGMLNGLSKIANDSNIRSFASSLTNGFLNVVTASSALIRALSPLAPVIAGLTTALGVLISAKLALAAFGWVKGLTAAAGAFTALKSTLALAGAQMVAISALGNPIAGAFTAASTAARGFVAALGPIGLAAAAIGVGVTAYFYATRDSVFSLRDEIDKLDKSLGSVNFEKYERFNEQGLGAKIDAQLALGGIKRSAENDNLATALLPEKSVQDFIENTNKITTVTNQALSEINNNSAMSAQERAEQELMVTERKHTLLKQQLERFDAATKDIETLDTASANVRKDLERQVYEAAVAYTDKRAKYALQQMLNLQVEAVKTRNILEAAFDVGGWSSKADAESRAIAAAQKNGVPLTPEQRAYISKVNLGEDGPKAYASVYVNNKNFGNTNKYLGKDQRNLASGIAGKDPQTLALAEAQRTQITQEINRVKQEIAVLGRQRKTAPNLPASQSARGVVSRGEVDFKLASAQQELKHLNVALGNIQNAFAAAEVMSPSNTKRKGGVKFEDSASSLGGKKPSLSDASASHQGNGGSRTSSSTNPYKAFDLNAKLMELEISQRKRLTSYLEDSLNRKQKYGVTGTDEEYLAKARSMYSKQPEDHANYIQGLKSQYLDALKNSRLEDKSPEDRRKYAEYASALEKAIKDFSPKGKIDIGTSGTVTTVTQTNKNGGGSYSGGAYTGGSGSHKEAVNGRVKSHASEYDYAGLERKYGLPANLLASIEMQESRGNVNAVSNVGAKGAFQIMPDTARAYKVIVSDIRSSSEGAARLMADLLKQFKGDLRKALTAYHSGSGNVMRGRIGPVGRSYSPSVLGYKANLDGTGDSGGILQVGSKSSSSSSTKVNKAGETETTYNSASTDKSFTFNTQAVTLNNESDGQYAQMGLSLTKEQEASVANHLKMVDEIRNTQVHQNELARLNLDTQIVKGTLTQGEVEAQRGKLELAKLEAEHQIKMHQIAAENANNAPARLEAEQRETEEYKKRVDYQTALNEKKVKSTTFSGGVEDAFKKMAEIQGDSAKLGGDVANWFGNTVFGAFDRFAIEGKKSFKDFASSVLKDLSRIFAKMAIMKLVGTIGGSMFGGVGTVGSTAASTAGGMSLAAKGSVFSVSGRLSAYAMGGIVNSPTNFLHAGGRGLMGESGPEAVMPLTRLPNGDLGVTAVAGASQGGTFINQPVSINVTVNSDGSSENDASNSDSRLGKELAQTIEMVVQQVLTREMRYGGMLANRNAGASA